MNSAARFYAEGVSGSVSRSQVLVRLLSQVSSMLVVTLAAVMVSALSLVYVTYQSRSLDMALQADAIQRNHMHVQWEQLLLEKGTWSTQARVQTLAENKLGMVMPAGHGLVVLKV